jgi:hypothetical protein
MGKRPIRRRSINTPMVSPVFPARSSQTNLWNYFPGPAGSPANTPHLTVSALSVKLP